MSSFASQATPSFSMLHTEKQEDLLHEITCVMYSQGETLIKEDKCTYKHICNKRDCEGKHSANRCPSKQQPPYRQIPLKNLSIPTPSDYK